MYKFKVLVVAVMLGVAGWLTMSLPASAQQAESIGTGGAIILEVGRAKMFRLDRIPSTIMFGNPLVADIVIDREGLVFLLGLRAGQTSLHILDQNGASLLTASIVVQAENRSQVTFNEGTRESTYYCSPRCIRRSNPATASYNGRAGRGGGAIGGGSGGASIFDDIPRANLNDRQ